MNCRRVDVNESYADWAGRMDLRFDRALVEHALRHYLTHLKRTREYKKKMRTDPETRDAWYAKRREEAREYKKRMRTDPETRDSFHAKRREYSRRCRNA